MSEIARFFRENEEAALEDGSGRVNVCVRGRSTPPEHHRAGPAAHPPFDQCFWRLTRSMAGHSPMLSTLRNGRLLESAAMPSKLCDCQRSEPS